MMSALRAKTFGNYATAETRWQPRARTQARHWSQPAIGDRLAAPEAAMGQEVVEVAGLVPTRCVNTLRSCRPGR